MMFGGKKKGNAISIFKWRKHESSLTSRLLNDVRPEIELSDYERAPPSPGSESPSGFLDAERLNVEPIADLDLFFERLYSYYCDKGLWCIIIKWVFELLSLAFIIFFSGFFLLYVDWDGLRNAKCGMDAVESGTKPCDLAKDALHQHPLTPFTIAKAVILGYLGTFSIYWIFCFLLFFTQLKHTISIRQFYYNSLHVTDKDIQTMPWALILEKVVQLQSSHHWGIDKDLSVHDVVMRLMRKENYLIGMLNKGVLAFPIFWWVPGAGPAITCGPNGVQHRLILTKTLEWTLNWCILQSMFDRNFCVRRDFISDPKTLKKRLMIVGFLMLLLSPFLIIFMLVYLFLRHAEQFYNHPSTASSRTWSNLAKWMFREFNEVDHLFKHRINSSIVHASNYLKQFPSPIITVIAKFISFVSGGFAAVLIIIAFLDESLLEGHILGRNLFWYAAVFGTITAIGRAAITDELLILDPQGAMSLVVQHTHYMPKRWRGKENTDTVRMEFETLFQYTGMLLLEEMASIFLTPCLLLFVVPKRVDDILQFIADFTLDVEGVGHICSFSAFDFQNHGNIKYGSPFDTPCNQRSSQGKMEKSFLSFHNSYPSWEPNSQGKQLLSKLKTFGEHKLQGQLGPAFLPSRMQHWNRNGRRVGDEHGFFTNEMTSQLGSMWMINGEQNNHPYILDWYYTSQFHRNPSNIPSQLSDAGEGHHEHIRKPSHIQENESMHDKNWGYLFEDRAQSHLGASTSAPLFHESILQHQDSSNLVHPTRSHWWARNQPRDADPQTSFLEPPNFNCDPSLDNYSSISKKNHLESSSSTHVLQQSMPQHDSNDVGQRTSSHWGSRNQPHGAGPETSFLVPPSFNRDPLPDHYTSISKKNQLASSTSTHQLQQSMAQHDSNDKEQPTRSHWWSRNQPESAPPHTSFLQPPDFNRFGVSLDDHDNYSERSLEEQEIHLDWRNSNKLSNTFYMDDLDGGEMNLPFDDIYQKSSEVPPFSNVDPSNLV